MSSRRVVAAVALAAWLVVAGGTSAAAAGASAAAVPVTAPAPTPTPTFADQADEAPPPGIFVEVNPSTVEAGFLVGIRASCTNADDEPPEDTEPAIVESDAFGEVELRPQFGILTGVATVPADTRARSYRVNLDCPGLFDNAQTSINVVTGNRPSRGPATGFGGTAGDTDLPLTLGAGLTALAAGLVLGVVTLRRRRSA